MAYALTVHCSVPAPPPRSRWIDGSAVITTRESSATMKYAIEVSSTVSAGLPWRVPGSPAPGGAKPAAGSGAVRSRSVIVLSVREKDSSNGADPRERPDWAARTGRNGRGGPDYAARATPG